MALPKFNVTPEAIKKGVAAAQQAVKPYSGGVSAATASGGIQQPTTGMSAATAGAGSQTQGSYPGSNTHQQWINNPASGQGGMDAYIAKQQDKFNTAYAANDWKTLSALDNDMKRVGYGLSYDAVKNTPVQTPPMGSIPQNDPVYNTQTGSQLNQYAQDQTALDRAALLNSSNTLMNSLKNNAEYSNQLIQDNRVLEDFFANQRVNPFSGGADYRAAMTARGRSIDDSARGSELSNRLNAISTELADFDRLTPERQRAIYNELLQLERNFAINQSGVTGMYGGNQTMAMQNQNYNQAMGVVDRYGYLPGNGSSASANGLGMNLLSQLGNARSLEAQRMDYDMMDRDRNFDYGVERDQRSDFESDRDFEYTQGRDATKDEQWEKEFQRILKQDGVQNAIQWANNALSREREERISSGGSGGGGSSRSSGSGAGSSQEGPSPVKATASEMNSMYDNLLSQYGTLNQSTNKYSAPTSQEGKQNVILRILDFNLPDDQTENLLRRFNLTVAEAEKILNTPAPKQPQLPTSGQLLRDTIKF